MPVPPDRWNARVFHDPDPRRAGRIKSAVGGFIRGIDEFDAEFFNYFPAEAMRLDPQQRLLLEVAHEAMEDAGVRAEDLSGSQTAVYVGAFAYDYLCMQTESVQRNHISPYVAMGTGLFSLSNRISYDFNLKGPSVTLDTACSSSLTAIHHACRSIWNGDADLAIAGGVNALLRRESSITLSRGGFLSPDGRCKAFDAGGNGYVRGEGAGLVILKPLSRAVRDGDRIYAVVRGSACNQDGYVPAGFTVPNLDAQRAMLLAAYRDAHVDPASVAFVEAHGPGTPAGDPIEAGAIGSVFAPVGKQVKSCCSGRSRRISATSKGLRGSPASSRLASPCGTPRCRRTCISTRRTRPSTLRDCGSACRRRPSCLTASSTRSAPA